MSTRENEALREALELLKEIIPEYGGAMSDRISGVIYHMEAASKPEQSEADDLLMRLGLDPEQYRTDGGYINHMKVRAAILHPESYPRLNQCEHQFIASSELGGRVCKLCGQPERFGSKPEQQAQADKAGGGLVAVVEGSVPHLRSIIVKAVTGATVPPEGALLYTRPPEARQPLAAGQVDSLRGLPDWLHLQAVQWEAKGLPADHEDIRAVRKWATSLTSLLAAHGIPQAKESTMTTNEHTRKPPQNGVTLREEAVAVPFEREDRYIVLKIKDIEQLNPVLLKELTGTLSAIANLTTMPRREYVVIESDWPEYELVWGMLEARVNGERSAHGTGKDQQ